MWESLRDDIVRMADIYQQDQQKERRMRQLDEI